MSRDVIDAVTAGYARSDRVFWLDGGGARSWLGRRSMVGVLSDEDVSLTFDAASGEVRRHQHGRVEVVGDEIFGVLEREIAADAGDPSVHWVGYFGYAARPDLPARPWERGPDAVWMRCTDVAFFDHPDEPLSPRHNPRGVDAPVPSWYDEDFAEVQENLRAGNSYEVNLTYRVRPTTDVADPLATYLRLRAVNPAPYAGLLRHGETHLLSASPERYATVDADRWLEAKPIKGTTPRGVTTAEDERLRAQLVTDPKYRGENLMIVDLLRNDLSMVCEPGTVRVPSLMAVESYASVHQLVSTVRGQLRDDVSTLAALWALFPAGSMTGAPKLRTMEIIDAVETAPRGIYSGAFGWICADGRADLGVVIRSLMKTPSGWEVGTGGGVTVRSSVEEEWHESRWKAARVLGALLDNKVTS
ncbi:MAG TPA: anthranilate synthase component I family protein [Marmoricola sp.]|nr:anthranilate synthase component I family protein [Marmoricola sp.]